MEPGALDDGPHPAPDLVRVRQPGALPGAPRIDGTSVNRALVVDRAWTGILWGVAIFVVAILLAIIAYFLITSIGTLSPAFVVGSPSSRALGGIGPLIFNSLYILILTM